jgi:hypothetical protein
MKVKHAFFKISRLKFYPNNYIETSNKTIGLGSYGKLYFFNVKTALY